MNLRGFLKNFAGVKALQDVDLTIYEGKHGVWQEKTAVENPH